MTLAIVFPGQGSQSVGMMNALSGDYPDVKATFAEASDALGYDLWRMAEAGPADVLNQTQHTQPAMLAAGVATYRVWRNSGGPLPAFFAGHSLGEYTALVCAEALAFTDAVKLVADRARYMQEAVPAGQGAMAAILGLDDAAVIDVCAKAAQGEVLSAVNFNSPGQVVIAGNRSAVDRGIVAAKEAGAKRAVILPVSVPSHCALMTVAAKRMAERLAGVDVRAPRVPVLHNVNVRHEADPQTIRAALAEQLAGPVRWVETIQAMVDAGVDKIIECGPGGVLSGLNKRISKQLATAAVSDRESLEKTLV